MNTDVNRNRDFLSTLNMVLRLLQPAGYTEYDATSLACLRLLQPAGYTEYDATSLACLRPEFIFEQMVCAKVDLLLFNNCVITCKTVMKLNEMFAVKFGRFVFTLIDGRIFKSIFRAAYITH